MLDLLVLGCLFCHTQDGIHNCIPTVTHLTTKICLNAKCTQLFHLRVSNPSRSLTVYGDEHGVVGIADCIKILVKVGDILEICILYNLRKNKERSYAASAGKDRWGCQLYDKQN